jgi:hypothetical protein
MPTSFTTYSAADLITHAWANLVSSSINNLELYKLDGGDGTTTVTLPDINGGTG